MGLKLCILMYYYPKFEYYGASCGDNCAKWILKIAEDKELSLSFEHIMTFQEPFNIRIANDGTIVKNMHDLVVVSLKWLEA